MVYDYTILMDGYWSCHICCSEQEINEICNCGRINPWTGVCPKCNKVRRVCETDGCDSDEKVVEDTTIVRTVAKNAIVDDKCRGFVKIEPLWQLRDKINDLVDAVNTIASKTCVCAQNKEQSK